MEEGVGVGEDVDVVEVEAVGVDDNVGVVRSIDIK